MKPLIRDKLLTAGAIVLMSVGSCSTSGCATTRAYSNSNSNNSSSPNRGSAADSSRFIWEWNWRTASAVVASMLATGYLIAEREKNGGQLTAAPERGLQPVDPSCIVKGCAR